MPVNISAHPDSKEQISNQTMIDALFGKDLDYQLPFHKLNRPSDAEGILIGGN